MIKVRELNLLSVSSGSAPELSQIATSLVGLCFLENSKDELGDTIRNALQRSGFFKARIVAVALDAPKGTNPLTISVIARVEAGDQYRLKGISFVGNKSVTNPTALRNVFPLKDNDVFDVGRVGRGLENLREAYGDLGYINLSSVPETQIDDDNKLISLNVDIDEGAQFFIRSFTIKDADQQREMALRALWPEMLKPGKIYNARLVKLFFERIQQLLPGSSPDKNLTVEQNPRENTVDIVLSTESNVKLDRSGQRECRQGKRLHPLDSGSPCPGTNKAEVVQKPSSSGTSAGFPRGVTS